MSAQHLSSENLTLFNCLFYRICCKSNEAVTATPVADPEVVKATENDEANTEVSEAVEADGAVVTEEAAEKEAEEKGYKCCGIY